MLLQSNSLAHRSTVPSLFYGLTTRVAFRSGLASANLACDGHGGFAHCGQMCGKQALLANRTYECTTTTVLLRTAVVAQKTHPRKEPSVPWLPLCDFHDKSISRNHRRAFQLAH